MKDYKPCLFTKIVLRPRLRNSYACGSYASSLNFKVGAVYSKVLEV